MSYKYYAKLQNENGTRLFPILGYAEGVYQVYIDFVFPIKLTKIIARWAMWIEGFNSRIDDLIKEEESLAPNTSFQFQHQVIANRAERLVLRSLIKEMNYKV